MLVPVSISIDGIERLTPVPHFPRHAFLQRVHFPGRTSRQHVVWQRSLLVLQRGACNRRAHTRHRPACVPKPTVRHRGPGCSQGCVCGTEETGAHAATSPRCVARVISWNSDVSLCIGQPELTRSTITAHRGALLYRLIATNLFLFSRKKLLVCARCKTAPGLWVSRRGGGAV